MMTTLEVSKGSNSAKWAKSVESCIQLSEQCVGANVKGQSTKRPFMFLKFV